MTPYTIENKGKYQCEFRWNTSTVNHIFSIWQVSEMTVIKSDHYLATHASQQLFIGKL